MALYTARRRARRRIGPIAGGVLVEISDWRLAFLVNLPIGARGLRGRGARDRREPRARGGARLPDLPGAMLLTVAIGALILAIVQGNDWGWVSPGVLAAAVVAIVTLGLFVAAYSDAQRAPLLDPDLLRVPAFSLANGLTVVRRRRVLLLHPLQRPVPHHRVGLLGPRCGPRADARPASIAAAVAALVRASGASASATRAVILPGALVWAGGVVYLMTVVGTEPAFLSRLAAGDGDPRARGGRLLPDARAERAIAAAPPGALRDRDVAERRRAAVRRGARALRSSWRSSGRPAPPSSTEAFDNGWLFATLASGSWPWPPSALRGRAPVGEEPIGPPLRRRPRLGSR